jgi:hypothetical protein
MLAGNAPWFQLAGDPAKHLIISAALVPGQVIAAGSVASLAVKFLLL